jgi:hypothetical protein
VTIPEEIDELCDDRSPKKDYQTDERYPFLLVSHNAFPLFHLNRTPGTNPCLNRIACHPSTPLAGLDSGIELPLIGALHTIEVDECAVIPLAIAPERNPMNMELNNPVIPHDLILSKRKRQPIRHCTGYRSLSHHRCDEDPKHGLVSLCRLHESHIAAPAQMAITTTTTAMMAPSPVLFLPLPATVTP